MGSAVKSGCARIADFEFAAAQDQVAGAEAGAQVEVEFGRAADGAGQALDGLFHVGDVPLGVGNGDLVHDLAPLLVEQGLQPAGLHDLDLADETAQTALGHVGGAVAGDVAFDVVEFLEELLFDGVKLGLAALPAFLALEDVGGVVAAVLFDAGAAEFPDAIDDAVQEVAVVADDEQGALPGLQRGFEPLDGFHVEVVGGLVEDEQVGLLQQEAGEKGASLLSAAEMREGQGQVILPEAKALQHLADASVVFIAADEFELVLGVAVLGEQRAASEDAPPRPCVLPDRGGAPRARGRCRRR